MSGRTSRILARSRGELAVAEPRLASRYEGVEASPAPTELNLPAERTRVRIAPETPAAAKPPALSSRPTPETAPLPRRAGDVPVQPSPAASGATEPTPVEATAQPAAAKARPAEEPQAMETVERVTVHEVPVERTVLEIRRDVLEIERIQELAMPEAPAPAGRSREAERVSEAVAEPPVALLPPEGPVRARLASTRATPPLPARPKVRTEPLRPAPAAEPEIHVKIGRIEIIAPVAPAPAPERPKLPRPQPSLSLSDYLAQRARGEF